MTEAATLASTILTQLGQDFTVPSIDLTGASFQLPAQANNVRYEDIPQYSVEDLTTGVVGGTGTFDKIMMSTKVHLQEQYEKGLISGDQYTKAYIELTTASMATGLQLLTEGKTAYWAAIMAQSQARTAEIEAVTAGVQLEIAKHQLAAASQQANMLRAQNVLVQMQIANEDAKHSLAVAQIDLVKEQTEAQRGQTMDTRTDGTTEVVGMIGKQKALYAQQVISYQRDAEVKVGKMWLDGWITQKTLDEGLTAPDQLTNAGVEGVLEKIRENHGLQATS